MEAAISTATMLRTRHFGISSAFFLTGIPRFFCALIFLAVTHSTLAGSFTWDGLGGNLNWSTVGNWTTGSAPTSSPATDIFFGGNTNTGTALAPINQDIVNPFSLNSLNFNLGSGSFFLGGGSFSFVGAANSIVQNSASPQSIANAIGNPTSKPTILTLGGSGTGIVTLSGVISPGVGGKDYTITKTGTSEFVLTGANLYTSATTISAGVLNIQNGTALGTPAAGTSVASGAALQIQGGITVGAETLSLNGSGIAADGALRNISGNNTYGGGITLASASTIASDSGTLTLSSTLVNGGFTFTLAGAGNITASGIVSGTGAFIKNGSGTVTLSGVNTFSGGSTMNGGTVVINSSSSLGATTGAATINAATLEVDNTFTSNRVFTLGNTASTVMVDPTFSFTLNGTGIFNGTGTLNKTGTGILILGSTNSYSGATNISAGTLRESATNVIPDGSAVTVASGATYDLNSFTETIGSLAGAGTVTSGAAGALTLTTGGDNTSTLFSGILQNGSGTFSLTKSGTGTLTLSGANTYSGLTTVAGGTLAIQSNTALGTTIGATTVSSGATLELQSNITVGAEPLTLNGPGVSNFGALRNFSGNNSFGGLATLASASTIYSDAGTLTLGGGIVTAGFTVSFGGAGNIAENGVVSGTGTFVKNDAGTLTLGGANTFTGASTINGGIVVVTSDANLGNGIAGVTLNAATLEIATGFSTNALRLFTLGNSASTFQVDAGQTFTVTTVINGPGTLNKTGAGTMVLSAMNTFSGGTNVLGGTVQISAADRLFNTGGLTISGGTFDLQTFTQTTGAVTLASGTISGTGTGILTGSTYTLQSGTVSAVLAGTGTVTKNTSGTVTLSGGNTFTGSTTISAGTLQVNSNNALGSAASGTTVANGAVLTLNGVTYTTAEPLTLNGNGISNGGALVNIGSSTFAGPINAATNATINAGGGTLTLTGGVAKNGTTLTIAGGGTVNINTNGITGSSPNSDLIVDGTTVVLNTANSYNGPTTIQNSGILQLGGNNVLPSSPQTTVTINTSSIFDLASHSDGVASITGDSTATIKNTSVGSTSTLTVNPASGSTTFAGVIAGTNSGAQGDIALQKNGAGTLILTGANTYSGTTTVNGGTLAVAGGVGGGLTSTSNVTVNSGGTLLLGASDQISNGATITLAGGTFAKGNFSEGSAIAPGLGALTLTATGSKIDFGTGTFGIVTFASFSPGTFTLSIDNWTGTIATMGGPATDRLIFASDQSGNLNNFWFTGYAPGAVEVLLPSGFYEVTPAAIPETSTWITAALALGVAGFHFIRRRRAKAVCA
jgi:fibronectin-binding autotransporter adhesin